MEDVECELSVSFDKPPLLLNEEELLGQVIYAGWADRVAKRIKGHSALSEGDRKVNEVRYQASWSEKRYSFIKFMAASPANILRLEASGHKRVGNLLYMLKTRSRTVDNCAMLREVWSEYPLELYSEILDWFQEGFHQQFEELWSEMHREVVLDP
ncbi:hypothetical protein LguiB_012903 [Lonicera macranthoides]